MEQLKPIHRLLDILKEYKYAALIVAAGLCLLLLPSGKEKKEELCVSEASMLPEAESLEEKLEQIISQIHGAGKVSVLLTASKGEQYIYQTDVNTSASGTESVDTVLITGADRLQTGLIRQIASPVYQGAIVVCKGAESAAIRFAIIDAVSKATGLTTDKICVLKMK